MLVRVEGKHQHDEEKKAAGKHDDIFAVLDR